MRSFRVCVVTPAGPGSTSGNRVTALRWAGILRGLGHRVRVVRDYDGQQFDLLVALHAKKSAAAVARFRRRHPSSPIVLALTGTDVYGDIHTSAAARRSLERATHLIALQPLAGRELPQRLRRKVRVIRQSAVKAAARTRRRRDAFEVCVIAHLRSVKDPLRAAMAARLLPASSRVHVLHLGAALDAKLARRARRETAANARYRWLGERTRPEALRLLARCRLLVLTSRLEGGSNALTEAIAEGVPVVSTRIPGVMGTLGRAYPGYVPFGDTRALAALLHRAERDRRFYADLEARCRRLKPLVSPARERRAWAALLQELWPVPPRRAR